MIKEILAEAGLIMVPVLLTIYVALFDKGEPDTKFEDIKPK